MDFEDSADLFLEKRGGAGQMRNETKDSEKKKKKSKDKFTEKSSNNFKKLEIRPQTENQEKLHKILNNKILSFAFGPAGCGKTYLAVHAAVVALMRNEISKIVITRSMVAVGKELGYLPGDEKEKMLPYVAPMIEYLNEFLGKDEVTKLLKIGTIEIVSIALLRGYTFKNSFIILDEAQNTTPHELKTILTRIGENSKMAILADLDQSDIQKSNFISGPEDFCRRIDEKSELMGFVELDENDVLRSEVVKEILKIYKNPLK